MLQQRDSKLFSCRIRISIMICWSSDLRFRRVRLHGSSGGRLLQCWILVWSHSAKRPLAASGAPPVTSMTLATEPSHHKRVGNLLPHRRLSPRDPFGQGRGGWTAGWESDEWRRPRDDFEAGFRSSLIFPSTALGHCRVRMWTTCRATIFDIEALASFPVCF